MGVPSESSSLRVQAILLLVVAIAHVQVAPFTKVEESWTLHAVHNFLNARSLSSVAFRPSVRD